MNDSGAHETARQIEQTRWFRALARSGYAANGLLHLLIGVIVLVIASGGRGDGDQAGALRAIVAAPLGGLALAVLAAALGALGIWHVLDGLLVRGPVAGSFFRKWGGRIAEWGQALVFLALGVIAASVALGARPKADESAVEASRGLIELLGGVFVLALIGLGIGIGGIAFIVMGFLRSFRKKMTIPGGTSGALITTLGAVGFVAKGAALAIVGVLLLVAAARNDPERAGGLDAAIDALLQVTAGPMLVTVVGAGFIAYGVFCFFRARYASL